MDFSWHPNEPPPQIEQHSRAKLDVLRSYLRAYIDRLNQSPQRETFKMALVDGFAGGGTYSQQNEVVSGSPLVMLEEIAAAKIRLNQTRTKPLKIECKFHFVDVQESHTDHLRNTLSERGYQVDCEDITIHNSTFENVADGIIEDIRKHQPKSGRAIFLLDQTGYSQVPVNLARKIFQRLPAAEIILTFAVDVLINFLVPNPQFIQSVAPLEMTEPQIRELLEMRNGDGGKALV